MLRFGSEKDQFTKKTPSNPDPRYDRGHGVDAREVLSLRLVVDVKSWDEVFPKLPADLYWKKNVASFVYDVCYNGDLLRAFPLAFTFTLPWYVPYDVQTEALKVFVRPQKLLVTPLPVISMYTHPSTNEHMFLYSFKIGETYPNWVNVRDYTSELVANYVRAVAQVLRHPVRLAPPADLTPTYTGTPGTSNFEILTLETGFQFSPDAKRLLDRLVEARAMDK